jgi:two-component system phosphate regulon sensor histidine kinase PhoR
MKRRTIRIIIVFALLSLIGIISTQIFWVKKAFNQQERLFNQRVYVALTNVAEEILSLHNDSAELYEPIKQIGSNYFIASINDTLHPYLLESLLKNEFSKRNIKLDFEYVIYDCFTDSIVYGNYVVMQDLEDDEKVVEPSKRKWEKDGHYFGVYFPARNTYLVNQMDIWIFSSIILLIVVIYFAYTTFIIIQQKRLSEIKTDFINNITHELKTPISTIALSTEVLLNDQHFDDKQKLHTYANIIHEENQRLRSQVNQVLQIATLDKGEIELNKSQFNLHKLIKQTVKSFDLIIASKQGKVTLQLNAKEAIITGDKFHFSNILFNLIDNGIKYSKSKVALTITTENTKKGLVLRVADKGIGIEKSNQKYIFEKFYRVPTGNKHDTKGFGLGLYYVKTILNRHHGDIRLISKPGEGSTFEITLATNS